MAARAVARPVECGTPNRPRRSDGTLRLRTRGAFMPGRCGKTFQNVLGPLPCTRRPDPSGRAAGPLDVPSQPSVTTDPMPSGWRSTCRPASSQCAAVGYRLEKPAHEWAGYPRAGLSRAALRRGENGRVRPERPR